MPWLYTLLGALLAFGLSIVPLAGLDADLEWMPSMVDRLQVGGLLVAVWPWFLGGRAAARLTSKRRLFFAGTLVLSALATVGLGSAMMEVLHPRQAMLLGVSGAGGTAVLWWLADQLRERGAMGGTMTVFGGLLVLDLPRLAWAQGGALAGDANLVVFGLGVLALLSPAVLGVVLWRRLPERPPVWLPVKHPLELVLLPLAVGQLAHGLRAGAPALPTWVDSVLILASVVAILAMTRAKAQGPPSLAVAGLVLGLLGLGGVAWGLHQNRDLLETRYLEGPLDGEHSVRVLCSAPGADLHEIERMRQRLEALRIVGNAQLLDDVVQLELHDITAPTETVAILTAPGRFEIRAESEDPVLEVADCLGCPPIGLGPPVLTNAHIERTEMNLDAYGTPAVTLTFTPDGKATFAAMSTQAVGERIAILLDGQVMSAPVVMEPITGGKAWVTLDPNASLQEAQTTAVLLGMPPLQRTWTARDIQPIDP